MPEPPCLSGLKYRDLRRLRKAVRAEWKRRYPEREPPKYGLLNKGFTSSEVQKLLPFVTSQTARDLFEICDGLGLRIGESCALHTDDLNLESRRLWIRSKKGSAPASMYLHGRTYDVLADIIQTGRAGKTYLFERKGRQNTHAHISPNWAAKELREARAKAGLGMIYDMSKPCGPHMRPRPLYRLSTHSFRHRFIKRIHDTHHDLVITQKLARHRDIRSTLHYTHKSQDELDNALQQATPTDINETSPPNP